MRRIASATTAPGGVTTLELDKALAYDHYGRLQYFGKKTEAYPLGKTLDERAEVGLLSRNVRKSACVRFMFNTYLGLCPDQNSRRRLFLAGAVIPNPKPKP